MPNDEKDEPGYAAERRQQEKERTVLRERNERGHHIVDWPNDPRLKSDAPTVEAAREHRSGCDLFDWDSRSNDPKPVCTCCALAKQAYIAQRFRAETESMRQAQGDDNAEMVAIARGDRDRKLDLLIADVRSDALREPPLWKHAVNECNEAHAALDRAGAPKTREVRKLEGDGTQLITIGLAARIDALRGSADPRTADWQPIETAPKMRTVLLYADYPPDGTFRNYKMATGFWHHGFDNEHDRSDGWSPWKWDGEQLKAHDLQPTHWMPLPSTPRQEKS